MGLISEKVDIKLNGKLFDYYKQKGYKISNGCKIITVDVSDLPDSSNIRIECSCDICGEKRNMIYGDYIKNIKKNNGMYICRYKTRHIEILAKEHLVTIKKEIQNYLNKNNRFPSYKEYNKKNGFSFGYSTIQSICKLNDTTLINVQNELNSKLSHTNIDCYDEYINTLKKYIENNKEVLLNVYNISSTKEYKKLNIPEMKWLIKKCPDKNVNDTVSFIRYLGYYPMRGMSKDECAKMILELAEKQNGIVQYNDFRIKKYGVPAFGQIAKYWGTLNNMKLELGLQIIQESMTDKNLTKEMFNDEVEKLFNHADKDGVKTITRRYISSFSDIPNYECFDKASKKYYNLCFNDFIINSGYEIGNAGRGSVKKYEDGEIATSLFEQIFSNFLRGYGLVYNKDYFRNVRYSTFSDTDTLMDCDYKILYKGRTIYIEIAGLLEQYKNYYYLDKKINNSDSKEKYRKKLLEKERLLKENNLIYFILFPCDLSREFFISILEDSSIAVKKEIELFRKNNINWDLINDEIGIVYSDEIKYGRNAIVYEEKEELYA